jgi:DNA repair exonuclease SbcCD ATPase subunit
MKIIRLNAENVKRLKAVEITPDGAVQIVAGRNAQGKSSVLDAIWMALDWKAAGKATPRPVRDGEDAGRVRLDLGDLIVTRKWTGPGKSTLLVEGADGATKQRPQELLDTLLGYLSFDPLAFTQQGDREQVQTLLGLVELPFKPDELDAERQALYDARHAIGQDLARAKGAFETLPAPSASLPADEASTTGLLAEYDAAQQEIQKHADVERRVQAASLEEHAAAQTVRDAQQALAQAQAHHATTTTAVAAASQTFVSLGEAPDLGPIKERLTTIEQTNAEVRAAVAYREAKTRSDALSADYEAKTVEIAQLDKRKADGLAAAKFPIDGLSFGEGGVTYNGVPFCQASSGEQLRVSLALAMAMNPELRVIRITDGSLLDAENMALINEMAAENDFQVWIERVDETGTSGVVIEDGQVAS